jgi:hypothetical protein
VKLRIATKKNSESILIKKKLRRKEKKTYLSTKEKRRS